MKKLIYILLLLCPFTLFGQDLYVTDSSVTHYLTDSAKTYYIYHDLSEQALLYLNGTVSTINNKIDTIFDENNNFNAIQTDTLKSPSLTDGEKEFDGVDDYIGLDSNIQINGTKGFTYIFNLDGSNLDNDYFMLFNNDDYAGKYHLVIRRQNLFIRIGDFSKSLDFSSPSDNFQLVIVFDGINNLKIYSDGVLELERSDVSELSTSFEIQNLFGPSGSSILTYNGSIDEVMIFNRALQPSEITELYER